MPRKHKIDKLLAIAATDDPKCVEYLEDELKLYDPSEDVVKAFVEHDPSRMLAANDSGSTLMHTAFGNIENIPHELLTHLLEKTPEALRKPNNFGLLPLHKAVMGFVAKDDVTNIKSVAEAYKDGLLARTKDGQLPLHLALQSPKLSTVYLVEMLLELEPSAARLADNYGQFALHKAAVKPKIDPGVIMVLLDTASEVAALKDRNGSLPLHLALSRDDPNLEIVYLLVGAYPEGLFDPDYEGQLPYDKLIQRSNRPMVQELSPELLALMEFARQQMHARKPNLVLPPAPNLR